MSAALSLTALSFDEISSFIQENYNMIYSAQQLKTLTCEDFIVITSCFLSELGYAHDKFYEAGPLEAVSALEDPELHEESLPLYHFFTILKFVLDKIEYPHTFNMDYIIKPKPKHTRSLFSYMKYYCKYVSVKWSFVENYTSEHEAIQHKSQKLKDENNSLAIRINEKKLWIQKKRTIEKIDERCILQREKLQDLDIEKVNLQKRNALLKSRISKLEIEKNDYKAAVVNYDEEIETLKAKILLSPDKFNDDLVKIEQEIFDVTAEANELQEAFESLSVKKVTANSSLWVDVFGKSDDLAKQFVLNCQYKDEANSILKQCEIEENEQRMNTLRKECLNDKLDQIKSSICKEENWHKTTLHEKEAIETDLKAHLATLQKNNLEAGKLLKKRQRAACKTLMTQIRLVREEREEIEKTYHASLKALQNMLLNVSLVEEEKQQKMIDFVSKLSKECHEKLGKE